jgi:hypothetical protein
MLPPRLPTAFDPRIGPRVGINSLPSIGPATLPGAAPRPPSIAPQQPPAIDIRSSAATTQNPNLQPPAPQAMRSVRLRPLPIGLPYAQANGGELLDPWSVPITRHAAIVSPTPSAKPPADANLILANDGDAGVQPAQQLGLPPQNKQTQQQIPASPPAKGLAGTPPALRLHEKRG